MTLPTCQRDTPGRERTRCGLPAREQPYYVVLPARRGSDGIVLDKGGPLELTLCAGCVEELFASLDPFIANAEKAPLRQTLDVEDRFGQPWSAEMLRALAKAVAGLDVPEKGRLEAVLEAQLLTMVDTDPELHAKIKRELAGIRLEKRSRAEGKRKQAAS